MTPTRCPYCTSDDLTHRRQHGATLTYCVACEATALNGQWSSGRALRRMRAAIDDSIGRRYGDDA